MNKLLEFYDAIYQGIDWRNYPTYENMVSIGEEHFAAVGIFLKDFQEWEQAGFPPLNEYLTPINGWKRTKYVAPPESVTLGKYTIKTADLEALLEKM